MMLGPWPGERAGSRLSQQQQYLVTHNLRV